MNKTLIDKNNIIINNLNNINLNIIKSISNKDIIINKKDKISILEKDANLLIDNYFNYEKNKNKKVKNKFVIDYSNNSNSKIVNILKHMNNYELNLQSKINKNKQEYLNYIKDKADIENKNKSKIIEQIKLSEIKLKKKQKLKDIKHTNSYYNLYKDKYLKNKPLYLVINDKYNKLESETIENIIKQKKIKNKNYNSNIFIHKDNKYSNNTKNKSKYITLNTIITESKSINYDKKELYNKKLEYSNKIKTDVLSKIDKNSNSELILPNNEYLNHKNNKLLYKEEINKKIEENLLKRKENVIRTVDFRKPLNLDIIKQKYKDKEKNNTNSSYKNTKQNYLPIIRIKNKTKTSKKSYNSRNNNILYNLNNIDNKIESSNKNLINSINLKMDLLDDYLI